MTRSRNTSGPRRPPIGVSAVRLVPVEGRILHIRDVDVVDGTPLLGLKPYVPEFEGRKAEKIGWLCRVATDAHHVKADRRFE